MEFECPFCGWSLEGGDETGVWAMQPTEGRCYDSDEAFKYCFHCGESISREGVLKKTVEDLGKLLNYPMADDVKLDKVEEIHCRLTSLIERDAR